MAIEITNRNGRGFHQYGAPLQTVSGEFFEVYESSSASGPHCWLRVFGGRASANVTVAGLGVAAHLNLDHAYAIHYVLTAGLGQVFLPPEETAYGEFVEICAPSSGGGGDCTLRIFGGESTVNQFATESVVAVQLTRDEMIAIQDRLMAFIRDVRQR